MTLRELLIQFNINVDGLDIVPEEIDFKIINGDDGYSFRDLGVGVDREEIHLW